MATEEEEQETRANLSPDTAAAIRKLRAINDAVSIFDPTLKERAVEVLLHQEFGIGRQPISLGRTSDTKHGIGPEAVHPTVEFAGLVERWVPSNDNEWTLLGAYFLTKGDADTIITGQEINTVLKHHGKGVANVTKCVDRLARADPALMLQVRKDGTSRQARKAYKVTYSGVAFVEDRLKSRPGS